MCVCACACACVCVCVRVRVCVVCVLTTVILIIGLCNCYSYCCFKLYFHVVVKICKRKKIKKKNWPERTRNYYANIVKAANNLVVS